MASRTVLLLASLCIIAHLITNGLAQSVNFAEDAYRASINETAPGEPVPTAPILTLTCEDDQTGNPATNVEYSLSGNSAPFMIDQTTGALTTSMSLDYESMMSYTFMAVCTNISDTTDSTTATVTIDIEPVNEYRPVFHGGNSFVQSLNESVPVNTIVITTEDNGLKQFTVTDQDAGSDETITFTFRNLTHSPNVPRFNLSRTSGALVVSQSLDVDILNGVTDTVLFEITACDQDPPVPECPRLQVSITILPVNDNRPQFSSTTYQGTLSVPATGVGRLMLEAAVNCTDADRGGVGQYGGITITRVSPDNQLMWQVNSQTGAITLTQRQISEISDTYTITLRCFDLPPNQMEDTATVTINVERNEPPVFATDRYNVTFSREAEVRAVIAQLSCSDNEKQVASYRFFNPSAEVNETFRVNNSGALILIGTLNVCKQSQYEVTVLCFDGLDQTANATVEIDVDRGRIYFENCNYTFELDRFTMLNGAVGEVTARSNEGEDIGYSLVEDNSFFTIDNNGRILLSNYILLIHGSTFTFGVEASIGSGAEQANDMATVTINVQGPLSVLEVIIIAAAGAVLLIILVLLSCIVGCCCCCHGNKTNIKNTNYYEEVSPPPLAPPQKGRAFRSSVTVPSPEDAEVSQSGLADDDIGHSTENLMEPAKEGDTIPLQEEKPGAEKKSETLGTTAM